MPQVVSTMISEIHLSTLVDIAITAILVYWLFLVIRGTRAVPLVIGVGILVLVYAAARIFGLPLLTQILETTTVLGLFALVVIFQPELRRGLERLGRVGSLGWLFGGAERAVAERVAAQVATAAGALASEGHGALIVIERETGLTEIAESGVMINGELSAELLSTIFSPRTALHDGAVIIHGETVVAAGALLPLAETTIASERFGTRHRAALGITEQTDAIAVVVSEENSQISVVERARIIRNLSPDRLSRRLVALLAEERGSTGLLASIQAPAQFRWLRRGARRDPLRPPPRPPTEEEGGAAAAGAPH
ncbi:MAG TPA: diadenylate cyclase CdaA [Candidatus Limnocylindrales bacterium]|nr:diadenylate cyclase CdaA [Candidatus Limnocylindrales bacterium]